MARIRTVKPNFFVSKTIAELSLTARLTFIGLWTHSDDEGRCHDDARLIKAALWMLDDNRTIKKVEADLCELEKHGFIHRYSSIDKRVIQVNNWKKHQRINKPSASELPPFPEHSRNPHGIGTEGSIQERKGGGKELTTSSDNPSPPAPRPSDDERASQALNELVRADYRRARTDGIQVRVPAKWRESTRETRVLIGDLDILIALAGQHPQASTDELVELLEDADRPRTRPLCGDCANGIVYDEDTDEARACECRSVAA